MQIFANIRKSSHKSPLPISIDSDSNRYISDIDINRYISDMISINNYYIHIIILFANF